MSAQQQIIDQMAQIQQDLDFIAMSLIIIIVLMVLRWICGEK